MAEPDAAPRMIAAAAPYAPTAGPDPGLAARMGAKIRAQKERLTAQEAELAKLRADKTAADKELTEFRARNDVPAAIKRADELAAMLREITHRREFDRIAAESGAKPEAVDALYRLSGYQADADQVDEATIRAAVDAQKAASPFLFGEGSPAAEGNAGHPVPSGPEPGAGGLRLPPGPGSHRGGSPLKTPQTFTEAQMSDPVFVMRNQARIIAAAKEQLSNGVR